MAKISKRYTQPMREFKNRSAMRLNKKPSAITEELRSNLESSLQLPVLVASPAKNLELEARGLKSPSNIRSPQHYTRNLQSPHRIGISEELFNKSELCLYLR